MGQRLAALVVVLAVGVSLSASAADQTGPGQVTERVLADFNGHRDQTIDAFLARLRPDPVDEASRAKVLASLPSKGEVRPSRKDVEKLQTVERILDYSARRGAITVKVIDVDSAFVGLYFRAVVLVSARALRLLTADELAALVAHEVGHDDDWTEYWDAMTTTHDTVRMQELELKADGIAVLTLERVAIDPERLVSAIQKMMRDNGWREGAIGAAPAGNDGLANGDRYVALADRVRFIRAVARLSWAEPPTSVAVVRHD